MGIYDHWKEAARKNWFLLAGQFLDMPKDQYTHERLSALKHVADEIDWQNGDNAFKEAYHKLVRRI